MTQPPDPTFDDRVTPGQAWGPTGPWVTGASAGEGGADAATAAVPSSTQSDDDLSRFPPPWSAPSQQGGALTAPQPGGPPTPSWNGGATPPGPPVASYPGAGWSSVPLGHPTSAPAVAPALGPQPGLPAQQASAYPLVPVPYHHAWRAPRWRWWKSLVLLAAGGVLFMLLQVVALLVGAGVDAQTGRVPWSTFMARMRHGDIATTPAIFTANNVSLDLLVPTAILLAWAVTRQRPGWLASVTGRFRWDWCGRCIAWISPLWLALAGLQYLASRHDPASRLHVTHDTWPLVLAILLTTPLQCAGEEFAFRGVLNRSIASWFPNEWVGLVAGGLANALVFMLAHGAGDPWLNAFYFLFGCLGTVLVRRTGGLEASIAMHVVNNVTAEWMLPFTDISTMFDRAAGTAGPSVLFNMLVPVLGVLVIEWRARRERVVNRTVTPLAARPAPRPMPPPASPPWPPAPLGTS